MAETTEEVPGNARAGLFRNATAGILLVLGLLLPWNIHFGLGIAGTRGWVFALLIATTVPAVVALRAASARSRWLLAAPYLVLVAVFTVFSVIVAIRSGGDGTVPPGVGPGAWSGLTGALLAARAPIAGDDDQRPYGRACRVIGWLSIVSATVAALLTLYLRTRYVIPGIGGEATLPNLTTAVAAVLYSAVAVAPVILVGRWIIAGNAASRLAVAMLGGSVIAAGIVVWVLPVGRLLDFFHGIAQRTGTSFVGYEGYLAWVAVAALVGIPALQSNGLWRNAIRSSLMLVAMWCAGQAMLRVTDVVLAGVLQLPEPPYNSTALMAVDLITAVLAAWLWINAGSRSSQVTTLLLGILFVMSVCRLILGVALMPTVEPLNPGGDNAVYGNHLAQQITSTFDIAVSVLCLVLLIVAVRLSAQVKPVPAVTESKPSPAEPDAPTAPETPAPAGAKAQSARIADVLAESTQRFAAGTTYGTTKPTPTAEQ